MSWWDNKKRGHSSTFLANEIHNQVINQYYTKNQNTMGWEQKAKKLQQFLYEIKNYEELKRQGEKTLFSEVEYNLFLNAYGEVRDLQGLPVKNTIFKNRGGTYFEKELADTQLALKKIFENDIDINNIKGLKGDLIIGQDRTVINFPEEELYKPIMQEVLKELGMTTKKYIDKEAKKNKDQDKKVIYFNSPQPKIDVRLDSVSVTTEMTAQYPNLSLFASLYSNATISAKNYPDIVLKFTQQQISIGNTNIFRILADFIPTLNLGLNRQQQIGFQYAIFNRALGRAKQLVSQDNEIPIHFNHIQNIYELMGVGQNYYKKDNQQLILNELNDLLLKGAELLIVNFSDRQDIIVKSTRQLLNSIYENSLKEHQNISILNKISVAQLT